MKKAWVCYHNTAYMTPLPYETNTTVLHCTYANLLHFQINITSCLLTGTAAGTCTLEFVIDAGIATGMVCPFGRCNSSGNGPGTGLKKELHVLEKTFPEKRASLYIV